MLRGTWVAAPRRVALVLAMALVLVVPAASTQALASTPAGARPVSSATLYEAPASTVPPAVSAPGWVVYDPVDDEVLAGEEATVARPMASTTKIMTALLALEAATLDDVVTVSANAAAVGRIPGAATFRLQEGEEVPMRSLLAGLVVRSGNDAATAVAEHVAGSVEEFVLRMNARASALGLTQTAFVNPTGLTDDPAHHASPLDLARLAEVAMRNPDFASWAGAADLVLPELGELANRNLLLGSYDGADGVKTGYTSLAGNCLVARATRMDRPVFVVVLGADDSFADSGALFDLGFTAWRRAAPAGPAAPVASYRWSDASTPVVPVAVLEEVLGVTQTATWRTILHPDVARPVAAGAPLGVAELSVDGEVTDEVELVAGQGVAAAPEQGASAAVGSAVADALRAFARTVPVERAA